VVISYHMDERIENAEKVVNISIIQNITIYIYWAVYNIVYTPEVASYDDDRR